VSQVFKFNKKTSQSQLSISPNVHPTSFRPSVLEVSNEDLVAEERKVHREWALSLDRTYYLNETEIRSQEEGLPILEPRIMEQYNSRVEEMKTLSVYLLNSSDLPFTNVRVKLIFKGYGTKNFYPKDLPNSAKNPDELMERELFLNEPININVPYIGANQEIRFAIGVLYGQFREAELILESMKSNGFTYIKNKTIKNLLGLSPDIILHRYKMEELASEELSLRTLKKIYGIIDETNSND